MVQIVGDDAIGLSPALNLTSDPFRIDGVKSRKHLAADRRGRMGMTLETLIVARTGDIGGFEVRRALPSVKRRMVGPFVFLDQMGPAEFLLGNGLDVRPHPHIGLATVT